MGIEPLGMQLSLPALVREKLKLEPGDIVSVSVIKELAKGKWAVGIKGTVFPARSSVELQRGEILRAMVFSDGGKIVLKLIIQKSTFLAQALQRAGISSDPLTLVIVGNLVKNNVKIDERAIRAVKVLLKDMKGDPKRFARLIGLLMAKGISPAGDGVRSLLDLLDYGYGGGRERRREERKKPGKHAPGPEEVLEALSTSLEAMLLREPSPVALFNHLAPAEKDKNWIVIPFDVDLETVRMRGSLRLLIDGFSQKLRKTVIMVENDDESRLHFILRPAGESYRLTICSNQKNLIGVNLKRWGDSLSKLHKLGVQCDDIIVDEKNFDGFDEDASDSGYQHIDMKG